jgi:hypothetical protein
VLKPLERRTAVKRNYHTIASSGKVNERKLAEFLSRNGQLLLPMVDLIEQSRMAVEELIDVAGRVTIEAVLNLSAQQVAGLPTQGKRRDGEVYWHGTQRGSVYLSQRKLPVNKPRLRKKGKGSGKEVAVPAYEAMQDRQGMGARMLDLLMRGVTTRQYQHVIPEMAETVGVCKSSVSRETIVAAEKELESLTARRFDQLELLIIYLDGMVFGDQGEPVRAYLGYAYARAGRRQEAEQIARAQAPFAVQQALIFAGLGDKNRTLDALERATVLGPVRLGRALASPEFALIRGDPRLKALRRRVGLPE